MLTGRGAARVSLGGIVLIALLAAGCGIRPSGVITGGSAPTWSGEAVPTPGPPADGVRLSLLSNGGLTWVLRPIRNRLSPAGTLTLLAGGPDADERASGLTTEVPPDIAPIEVTSGPSGMTVTLSRDVSTLSTTAVDQIVCTAGNATAGDGGAPGPVPVTVTGRGHTLSARGCPSAPTSSATGS
jgi:hypothetical protein